VHDHILRTSLHRFCLANEKLSPIPRHPLSPGLSERLSCVDPKRVSAWSLFFCSSLGVLMGREGREDASLAY